MGAPHHLIQFNKHFDRIKLIKKTGEYKFDMRKQAFTLAEILITLVVIGVVAALTIPSLMNNTKNEANIAALKKFYSTMNQALVKIADKDCGTPGNLKECFSTHQDFENAIANQFKLNKNCNYDKNENCWAPVNDNFDGSGSETDFDSASDSALSFITLDSMSVILSTNFNTCSFHGGSNVNAPIYNMCGTLNVDVNGIKPPNRAGIDVFMFYITSNKSPLIYPRGGKDFFPWEGLGCQKSKPAGYFCTARIMENGWKADYSDVTED